MDMDTLSNDTLDTMMRASLSLEGMLCLAYPPLESRLDFWKRVWPWIQFFDVYRSRMPNSPTDDIIRAGSFNIIAHLCCGTEPPIAQISACPGVGLLATKLWVSYFQDPKPSRISQHALQRLGSFLLTATHSNCDLEEYIDGAGGVDALAKLVVQLTDYLLNWDNVLRMAEVGSVVSFASSVTADYASPSPSGVNAWLSALQSHKYPAALVSVLLLPANVAAGGEQELLQRMAWDHLFPLLWTSYSYSTIVDAIDAGLLRLVVSHTAAREDISTNIRATIKLLIQPATIYYSVLSAVEDALPLVAELTSKPTFISSTLHADWKEFINLVSNRLKFKEVFDSGQYPSHKACDNLEVRTVALRGP
ncbi:hypothetical protein C8R45DRAFT_940778 [Mycena sanguinolenta]|nr:hypothetical protein C8R45DRAFT_940778 [Mycena sanguinolenta]